MVKKKKKTMREETVNRKNYQGVKGEECVSDEEKKKKRTMPCDGTINLN